MATPTDKDYPPELDELLLSLGFNARYNRPMIAHAESPNQDWIAEMAFLGAPAPIQQPESPLRLVTHEQALVAGDLLLAAPDEATFRDELRGAPDDPYLGRFGLMPPDFCLARLYEHAAPPYAVRPDLEHVLGTAVTSELSRSGVYCDLVLRALNQIRAKKPRPARGEGPDITEEDLYGWLFAPSVPAEIRAVMLDKIDSGIVVALLDIAAQRQCPLAHWLAAVCVAIFRDAYVHQLRALLGSALVDLPEARGLGLQPVDLAEVWARHQRVQQAWQIFDEAAEASGLPVFPVGSSDDGPDEK